MIVKVCILEEFEQGTEAAGGAVKMPHPRRWTCGQKVF